MIIYIHINQSQNVIKIVVVVVVGQERNAKN